MRIIAHIDMDAFFCSVEELDNPSLKGKPVIVGSDPKDGKGRGVVSTSNYEARKYKVFSAMPIQLAYRKCPNGIYIRPRMHRYVEMSKIIMDALKQFSPMIEQISIDEAFIDLSNTPIIKLGLEKALLTIRQSVFKASGLTCSGGLASNKSIAKISSDMNKPNGQTIVEFGKEKFFLAELSIKKLWGVGPKTMGTLNSMGYFQIQDLAKEKKEILENKLGKNGTRIWYLANGIDNREVISTHQPKSLSKEHTFLIDIENIEKINSIMKNLAEDVAQSLKRKNIKGKTINIKIRYSDFSTYTRSKTISFFTNSTHTIKKEALLLLQEFFPLKKPIRLLGLGLSKLDSEEKQLDLFSQVDEKNSDKLMHDMSVKFPGTMSRASRIKK